MNIFKPQAILWIWWLLILFGVIAVYSVSIHESFALTLKLFDDPTNNFYFFRHIRNIWFALMLAIGTYYVPLTRIKKYSIYIFVATFCFQLLVFTPLGSEFNGARWWLRIPGLTTIQPAEFFKLWFIFLVSTRLVRKKNVLWTIQWFWSFLIITWLCYVIFLLIPDLGVVLVLSTLSLVMYRYGGWRKRFLLSSIIIWMIFWFIAATQIPYIRSRLEFFFSRGSDTTWRGIWRQTNQALIAIWWWGIRWQWYGKWLQKFGYIPEAQSDFIFAAYSEEIWFLWNSLLLSLFFVLAWSSIVQLQKVWDQYYKLVWSGIISLLIIQTFINIWVNTNILPLTGLTLPFISTGGSSIMVSCIGLMILYKIVWNR